MNETRVLDTVAALDRLAEVMRFVRETCGAGREDELPGIDLVVEELFLNIVKHACPGETVRVACSLVEPGLAGLEFIYGGARFDPTAEAPEPDLEASLADRRIGGLGVFLVREMSTAVTYRWEGGLKG